MRVIHLIGKYINMTPLEYVNCDRSLVAIRRISDKEKREVAKLLEERFKRRNEVMLSDSELITLLTMENVL